MQTESRFHDISFIRSTDGSIIGFTGLQKEYSNFGLHDRFSASFPLFIISEAWHTGCNFEELADGFGLGMGTRGDWSSIRDSSDAAIQLMFNKALNHLFPWRTA